MIPGFSSKVLAIAAHVDDAEMGCGASLSRFKREGADIFIFSMTDRSYVEPEMDLAGEFRLSMASLGANQSGAYNRPMRLLHEHRQEILDDLFRLNDLIHPAMVFCPSTNDHHRDHRVVAEECQRAFKGVTTLAYEMPWNCTTFSTHCFIAVSDEDLDTKIRALKSYKSQYDRTYMTEEYVRSLAVTRGLNAKSRYAEAFEVVRWIIP